MKHPRYNHLDIIDKDQQKKSEIALWFTIFMTSDYSYWMSSISQILHPTRNLYSYDCCYPEMRKVEVDFADQVCLNWMSSLLSFSIKNALLVYDCRLQKYTYADKFSHPLSINFSTIRVYWLLRVSVNVKIPSVSLIPK